MQRVGTWYDNLNMWAKGLTIALCCTTTFMSIFGGGMALQRERGEYVTFRNDLIEIKGTTEEINEKVDLLVVHDRGQERRLTIHDEAFCDLDALPLNPTERIARRIQCARMNDATDYTNLSPQ